MFNVLEDLALPMSEALQNITQLLKASPQDFKLTAEKFPERISGTIATMRNIALE